MTVLPSPAILARHPRRRWPMSTAAAAVCRRRDEASSSCLSRPPARVDGHVGRSSPARPSTVPSLPSPSTPPRPTCDPAAQHCSAPLRPGQDAYYLSPLRPGPGPLVYPRRRCELAINYTFGFVFSSEELDDPSSGCLRGDSATTR